MKLIIRPQFQMANNNPKQFTFQTRIEQIMEAYMKNIVDILVTVFLFCVCTSINVFSQDDPVLIKPCLDENTILVKGPLMMKYMNLACPDCTFYVTYYEKQTNYMGNLVPDYEIARIDHDGSEECKECPMIDSELFTNVIMTLFDISIQGGDYAKIGDNTYISASSLQPCWKHVHEKVDFGDMLASSPTINSWGEYIEKYQMLLELLPNIDEGNMVWKPCSIEKCCKGFYQLETEFDPISGVEKLKRAKYFDGTINLSTTTVPCSFSTQFNCVPKCTDLLFSGSKGYAKPANFINECKSNEVVFKLAWNTQNELLQIDFENSLNNSIFRLINSNGESIIDESFIESCMSKQYHLSNLSTGCYLYYFISNGTVVNKGKFIHIK